jgi:hypothetical protein
MPGAKRRRRFVGETEIATSDGETRIDQIEPGELVRCQYQVSRRAWV